VDIRCAWRLRTDAELSLAVENLFDRRHLEFVGSGGTRTEVGRGVYGKLRWSF
jgi:outer membrane receptor protein involved in Fe transport